MEGATTWRVTNAYARLITTAIPALTTAKESPHHRETIAVSDRRVLEVNFAPSKADSAAPASVAERTAQLVAACEQFKIRRVHVLAHGFGALTALALLQSLQVASGQLVLSAPRRHATPCHVQLWSTLPRSPADRCRISHPRLTMRLNRRPQTVYSVAARGRSHAGTASV